MSCRGQPARADLDDRAGAGPRHRRDLIVLWYLAAILMNCAAGARRVRAQRNEIHHLRADRRNAGCRATDHAGAASGGRDVFRRRYSTIRPISPRSLRLPLLGDAFGHFGRLRTRRRVRHCACGADRACADVWRRACCPGSSARRWCRFWRSPPSSSWCFGAIGIRGLLPKSIISAYLCFFPVTIGMVKGLTLAGSHSTRTDADLVGKQTASFLEVALAVLGTVSVHQPESLDDDFAGRRHRRRIADRRPGRHRRAAADRLVLWPDGADLGGAVCRRDASPPA